MTLWSRLCRYLAGITPEVEQAIAVRREAIAAREARKTDIHRSLRMAYRAGNIRAVKELTAMAREQANLT